MAYEDFDKRIGIILLHGMAHTRHKFSDALQNDKERAQHASPMLPKRYAIEGRIKQEALSAEAILKLRQEEAVAILKMVRSTPCLLPAGFSKSMPVTGSKMF